MLLFILKSITGTLQPTPIKEHSQLMTGHNTGSNTGSDLRARAKQAWLGEVQKGSATESEKAKQGLWEGSRSSGV